MTIWFTSDLHLGHERIVELCKRPFSSVEEMNETIIDNWNSLVTPYDEVYVVGDFALGRRTETVPLADRLNGRKRLVPGNHDSCWPGHKKVRERDMRLYWDHFTVVEPDLIQFQSDSALIEVCHLPYAGDLKDEDRFVPLRPRDRGNWLIHGHVHDLWKTNGRMINVGVDVWDFKPVNIDEILAIIDRKAA